MTMKTRLIASVAAVFMAAAPSFAQDTTADTVLATVNGTEITVGHMILLRNQLPAQYQQLGDDVLFDSILEQLIQQTVLVQLLGDDLSRADQLSLENDRRSYLAAVALTKAANDAATDDAVQALYDSQYVDFIPTTEYNAAHILVSTLEEAQAIKAAIDGGADFAEQAQEHSSDGSSQGGGALGWFGPGMMVPQFEAAVMAMEVGTVSDPVETQFGWHLVKLNETRQTKVPALDEVRDQLTGTVQQQAVEALIAGLVEDADVTRAVEGIDRSVLSDQSLLQN